MTTARTVYKLKSKIDDKFLLFQEHGDGTEIFALCHYKDDQPAIFEKLEDAISAICTRFYFHHGVGSISEKSSAKDRLAMIEIIKAVTVEEETIIVPDVYVPTNIEMHEYYTKAKGDRGLAYMLKSQMSEDRVAYRPQDLFEDDSYEFADSPERIKGYNEWVAAGKPVKAKRLPRV